MVYGYSTGQDLQLPIRKGHRRTSKSHTKVPHLTHPPPHPLQVEAYLSLRGFSFDRHVLFIGERDEINLSLPLLVKTIWKRFTLKYAYMTCYLVLRHRFYNASAMFNFLLMFDNRFSGPFTGVINSQWHSSSVFMLMS